MTSLRLYLIQADNADGENLDLFAWANTPSHAATLWRENYELSPDDDTDRPRVWVIPTTPPATARVVGWPDLIVTYE
jgi:hypothetical protein